MKNEEISVIIQGQIIPRTTVRVIESVKYVLPGSYIIVSTWVGEDLSGIEADLIIQNIDPKAGRISKFEINNVKRQVVSTISGLRNAKTKYSLKIRSDVMLRSRNFTDYFDKYALFDEKYHFFKKKIVVTSMLTRDPRYCESPMCPSDWVSFGLTSDMIKLWNCSFRGLDDKYFKKQVRSDSVKYYYKNLDSRFNPEQYIWIDLVNRYKGYTVTDNMFDIRRETIRETLETFLSNIIIVDMSKYGIKLCKHLRPGCDAYHNLTQKQYVKLYNNRFHQNERVPIFDIEKMRLFDIKHNGLRRLRNRAICVGSYWKYFSNEVCYFFGIKREKEKVGMKISEKKILDSWPKQPINIVGKDDRIKMSIVVPTHGRVELFKQTLKCLERQTSDCFEVIVTDDSSIDVERKEIKDLLEKSKLINKKYIFTKPNLLQPKNTNQGLALARGQYIRILHSDDILADTCVESEIRYLDSTPNICFLYHHVKAFTRDISFKNCKPKMKIGNPTKEWLNGPIFTGTVVPSGMAFRRELVEIQGGMKEDYLFLCDWEMFFRYLLYCEEKHLQFGYIEDGLVGWRVHENSVTGRLFICHYKEHKDFLKKLKLFYKWNGELSREELANNLCLGAMYRMNRVFNDYIHLSGTNKLIFAPKMILLVFQSPELIHFILYVLLRCPFIALQWFNQFINRLAKGVYRRLLRFRYTW
mgnify:CR=1 FL=1